MKLYWIIYYLTSVVWIFPLFRQYGTKYFLYFLIYACASVSGLILLKGFSIQANSIASFAAFFLVLTFWPKYLIKKVFIVAIPFFILLMLFHLYDYNLESDILLNVFFHLLIMFLIVFDAIDYSNDNKVMSLFHTVLMLYEVTLMFRFITALSPTDRGEFYYASVMIFEILVALFFCFVRYGNTKFVIKIKAREPKE